MSSQETIINSEEKKTVSVLGFEVPKWLVKLVVVVVAIYIVYYLYKNNLKQTVSLSSMVPITVPTVESVTPAELK